MRQCFQHWLLISLITLKLCWLLLIDSSLIAPLQLFTRDSASWFKWRQTLYFKGWHFVCFLKGCFCSMFHIWDWIECFGTALSFHCLPMWCFLVCIAFGNSFRDQHATCSLTLLPLSTTCNLVLIYCSKTQWHCHVKLLPYWWRKLATNLRADWQSRRIKDIERTLRVFWKEFFCRMMLTNANCEDNGLKVHFRNVFRLYSLIWVRVEAMWQARAN